MRLYLVTKRNLKGDYENLYSGKDREAAQKIYNDNCAKKDEYREMYLHTQHAYRKISRAGHEGISNDEAIKVVSKPVVKKKKPTPKKTISLKRTFVDGEEVKEGEVKAKAAPKKAKANKKEGNK